MSYHSDGQYQSRQQHQSPPPPPRNPYYHPHGQQQQPTSPDGGGYGGQTALQTQQQYPGQAVYGQAYSGGAVQQLPNGFTNSYHSPSREAPTNASHGQHPSSPYSYNPQHYSPTVPQGQQTIPLYTTQALGGMSIPSYTPQQYNPSAYAGIPLGSTSGPLDPYSYSPASATSPSTFSIPSRSPQQASQQHFGNAAATLPTRQLSYAPYPTASDSHGSHTPALQPSQGRYGYQSQAALAETTQPSASNDRRQSSSINNHQASYATSPAISDSFESPGWAPSPPVHSSGSIRSTASQNYPSRLQSLSGANPGPTPPVHRTPTIGSSDANRAPRPLPDHPEVMPDYEDYTRRDPRRYGGTYVSSAGDQEPGQDRLFDDVLESWAPAGTLSMPSTRASRGDSDVDSSFNGLHRGSGSSRNGRPLPTVPQNPFDDTDLEYQEDVKVSNGLPLYDIADSRDSASRDPEDSDGDEYFGIDISNAGGGPDVGMAYGGSPLQLAGVSNGEYSAHLSPSQLSPMRPTHASLSSREGMAYRPGQNNTFNPTARVDSGGLGGLLEPGLSGRRRSYDEGDEDALMDGPLPDRFPDEPPDISFQAARPYHRPLPPPPLEARMSDSRLDNMGSTLPNASSSYPLAPENYGTGVAVQHVPRSTSLVSHSNPPLVSQTPSRSKTDADDRRLRTQHMRGSPYSSLDGLQGTSSSSSMLMDLPAIGKRFIPGRLGAADFKKCSEPWALSALLRWLLQVTNSEQNVELKESEIKEALVALFTSKVPTMNITDAEILGNRVVEDMYLAGTLHRTEEWVKITAIPISGVIFQLSQSGCYSPRVHEHIIPNMRCYSHHCQRTLKKVNLQAQTPRMTESWAEFYGLKHEDIKGRDKKELERQYVLHEIVSTEEGYMATLDVLRTLYRDQLASIDPTVISPERKVKFLKDVFGRVDAVKQANEEYLLPQLKYRQIEQGPYIVGFSDIFRQWIRKAKVAYVEYANDFAHADYTVRQEMERNMVFRQFVETARNDPRSSRLSLDSFLKSPISRLQRYTLLLATVLKMTHDGQEKTDLQIALSEVKEVVLECDARVAEMQHKVDLMDLKDRLVLRPAMKNVVELNLDHFGRQLIFRGDVQRMGSTRFTWLDCHALLFDHYLILAKTVTTRPEQGGRLDKYDVSRLPIPMDLLMLESVDDPVVQRSNYMRGITTVTTVTGRAPTNDPSTSPNPTPTGLQLVNTNSSPNVPTVAGLNPADARDADRILYPFKVKHLGFETYTLFATTEGARRDWCNKIIEAKTKHAAALHAQDAEPFRLRVMADSAFVYEPFGATRRGVIIKGTPLDRAIEEVEKQFDQTGRPTPICRTRVNCAATFTPPSTPHRPMIAVGTDNAVFISEIDKPRGWRRAINLGSVTQISVLEEFNLFLLISDKALLAWHLDDVCASTENSASSLHSTNDSSRRAPKKLSGSKDVGFFVAGKMKDRTLIFYKKRENLNSVFKVLEPVYQKSSDKKRNATGLSGLGLGGGSGMPSFFKRGSTDFFREYDEFYIPAESSGINLFTSSLAVSTTKGFEVLTLDRKQPQTVPLLFDEAVQNIAQHIRDLKPLSMLRLSDVEFLLCYASCAVYIGKNGEVSRSVVMDFVGTACHAALYGPYLVLFDQDFVEIRNAQNGRLKQIIAGREVKCLDDGSSWSSNPATPNLAAMTSESLASHGHSLPTPTHPTRTLKMVMQHPKLDKVQIIVELLLNENMKE